MISPTVLNTPFYSRYPPTFIMISPTVVNTPTVLKISPHGTHDIPHGTETPHGTEHPHGTTHTLYRVLINLRDTHNLQSSRKAKEFTRLRERDVVCILDDKVPKGG